MKILFIHQYVGSVLGGTERHLKELADNFCQMGHKIEILTAKSKRNNLLLDSKIKIYRLPVLPFNEEKYLKFLFKIFYHLKIRFNSFIFVSHLWLVINYLKGNRWDIISVHWIDEAYLIRKLKWLLNIPYVFILEGYTFREAEEAKLASCCITISNFIADKCLLQNDFKPLVIPLGINTNRFYPIEKEEINSIYSKMHCGNSIAVLSVGRLVERKNYISIIQAAAIVLKKFSDAKFFIIGSGPERIKLERIINNLNLNNKIILLGNISEEDLPKYYSACDIFLHYPYIQQFEIVNLEAMACAKPIIGSDSGAAKEVLDDSCILVPVSNIELLADAVLELSRNEELRKKISKNAIDRIKNNYKWSDLRVKYENIFINTFKK